MTKNNWVLPWNEALTTSTGELPASTATWSCYCCLHLLFSFYFQVLHSVSTAGNGYLQPFEIKYGYWNDSEKCGIKYKCQNILHILRAEITRILVKITENDLTIFDQQFIKIKFVIGEVLINETILQQQNCNTLNANSLVETPNSRHLSRERISSRLLDTPNFPYRHLYLV
jgi:hypothetical protein